jgi:hypothetical protein
MLEAAQDTRHRDAIRAAHVARGAVVQDLWKRLFARQR